MCSSDLEIGREQRVERLVDVVGVREHRVAALARNRLGEQRGEGRRVGAEAAVGVPDVITEMRVLRGADDGRVGVLRRARRVRAGIVEELAEEAREPGEILRRHRARLEHHEAAVVQQVAYRGAEIVPHGLAVEAVAEAMKVANALGINLETAKPEDAWVKASAGLPFDFKPSVLQTLEKRMTTEIDFINGAVVRAGREAGIATPVNATLVACIKGIERAFDPKLALKSPTE